MACDAQLLATRAQSLRVWLRGEWLKNIPQSHHVIPNFRSFCQHGRRSEVNEVLIDVFDVFVRERGESVQRVDKVMTHRRSILDRLYSPKNLRNRNDLAQSSLKVARRMKDFALGLLFGGC